MSNTPLIDAALEAAEPQRWFTKEGLTQAKAKLQAEVVYNVDFNNAKDLMRNALEFALSPLVSRFWDAHRQNWHVRQSIDLSSYVQLNHCKGVPNRLKKFAHLPEIQAYLAVIAEGALLSEMVEAAKPRVKKGRVPAANPTPIDLSNTGTCAICWNRQKLNANRLVHHGYTISAGNGNYYGTRIGKCFGCGYQPYELSCEANVDYKACLVEMKTSAEDYLKRLDIGEVTELTREVVKRVDGFRKKEIVKYHPGDAKWDVIFESECKEIDGKIRFLTAAIDSQSRYIREWKLAPLPGEKAVE